jgi:hypothetical protein
MSASLGDLRMIKFALAAAMLFCLAACGRDDGIPGYNKLENQVTNQRVGYGQDQWIEMRNGINEWERTGLIFGYTDDYSECIKAIEGLKLANDGREYRCTPAN